jgi:hypothetical protein
MRSEPLKDARQPRRPGSARGQVWMLEDFEKTPEDFKEYVTGARAWRSGTSGRDE